MFMTLVFNFWWLTIVKNSQNYFKTKMESWRVVKRKKCFKSTSVHYALQYALEEFMVMHDKKK